MLRKLLVRLALGLAVLLAVDLVVQLVALRDGELAGHRVVPFDPPVFEPDPAAAIARMSRVLAGTDGAPARARFDAELGWCVPAPGGEGAFRYDALGARLGAAPLRRAKAQGVRRLAVYGGSMAHGDEVGAREAWPAQLDALSPALEVANLGVSAFALDQALLRLRRDGPALQADAVWLVWVPAKTLGITTLFRPLVGHWPMDAGFKPRFRLANERGDAALELVPCPAREPADVARLLSDQALFLARLGDGDPWLNRARSAYAPRGSALLLRSGLARVLLTVLEGRGRDMATHLADGHPTRALLEALVLGARDEALARGATFRLLVLPSPSDLGATRAGPRVWRAATAALQARGVQVVDLFDALWDGGGAGLYTVHGYLNAAGGRVAAEALAALP